MKRLLSILAILISGCTSTSLVNNWKNPEIVIFDANKVLIVGMTANEEARVKFETKLQKEFDKRNIESFRSIDLFDVEFTSSEKSEEELSEVELQLLNKDFDAILFTKIIGSENKQSFKKRMSDTDRFFDTFSYDYLEHQSIYYENGYYDEYTVYQAETSLYCICFGKERQLIWRGNIEITDPVDIDKTVDDYVKLVVFALKEQDLIFRKKLANEITGL
ncbi:hypothetical protein [Flagellimonas meridianipacifica]|uniref:Cardiolipin synthetase n=1 Tax=Flagellimonas meridianipacifica TaxID=1080225 RepID=A0A2T0MI55_9FLAO|nr:hypothetical protein [Allomuricauda pacifica]PRX57225.1 hypothetical protein CLV81_1228 [Allomuricauda pacifica]